MKKPVQIFKHNFHAYSDVYASREKAIYAIGRPDGGIGVLFTISEREVFEILHNLSDELLNEVKEHYGLTSAVATPEETKDTNDAPDSLTDEEQEIATLMKSKSIDSMNQKELRKVAKYLEIEKYSRMSNKEIRKAIHKVIE